MANTDYLLLLRNELIPALGCTEPIAIAFASARARKILGCFPDSITVACSGNIIKNVKGVIVPTTGNLRGVEVSALLGAVAGNSELGMEVLKNVHSDDVERVRMLKEINMCHVKLLSGGAKLHILIKMQSNSHSSLVEIADAHTNIIREEKDGKLLKSDASGHILHEQLARQHMTVREIYDFATSACFEDIYDILKPQVEYNLKIAQEGLKGNYGMQVGRTYLESSKEKNVRCKAIAYAAAGSDARMSGCELPVVINSGSGNQGITASLPVILYAQETNISKEKMYRALALSNLITLYQKSYIGELSAYCGVISAACGSIAAIAYLCNGDIKIIENTIINTIACVSGIACDGAKPSCAAKIAVALEAGFLGLNMAQHGKVFQAGEGLVKENVDATIAAFGRMGREGMKKTDEEILNIMLEE